MPKHRNATSYSDQKNWSNTYLTDPSVLRVLGPFDTDPCCPPRMPWRTAKRMFSHEPLRGKGRISAGLYNMDGLVEPWRGRVFMNPPYRGVLAWARRFAQHANGVALLNGRSTETRATQLILRHSAALWLPPERRTFFKVTGKPYTQKWFPSLLIGASLFDAARLGRAQKKFGGVVLFNEGKVRYGD